MAEERDQVVPPPVSPLAPDLPVAAPISTSEIDDDPSRMTGASGLGAGAGVGTAGTSGLGTSGLGAGGFGAGTASTGVTGTTASTSVTSDDPEEIREQIERTREDMSHTLNELQERLSPQHLAQQAKDSVREATVGRVQNLMESAGDTASSVADRAQQVAGTAVHQVREHPVPVALAGAGAGLVWWLMRRSSNRPQTWDNDDMYEWDDADMTYERDYATLEVQSGDNWNSRGSRWSSSGTGTGSWTRMFRDNPVPASIAAASIGYMLWNRRSASSGYETVGMRSAYAADDSLGEPTLDTGVSGATAAVKEQAREVTRSAKDAASAVAEQASSTVQAAQTKAGEVSRNVSQTIRTVGTRTSTQFDRWMRDNPMAVGVAALAAGAVVGLTVPRTETENQVMGETRDALIERATDSAQHLKEQVRDKVQSVAGDLTNAGGGDQSSSSMGSSQV